MTTQDNPCRTCPDTCCELKGDCGLRLSQDEFDAHFKEHAQGLRVRREGRIVVISTNEGRVCPNLGDKGCWIYAERPIDCRLYPYQMLPVYETREKVKFMLYMTPDCVANRGFHFPVHEARSLVEAFGRKVYWDKKITIRIYEDRLLPKIRNKLETMFFKLGGKMGIV